MIRSLGKLVRWRVQAMSETEAGLCALAAVVLVMAPNLMILYFM
jgi:hypothetical protein|tara:strand:+ start:168 stop:299 length:132 start_codon:yes stop_codon:yes gene_type:complete